MRVAICDDIEEEQKKIVQMLAECAIKEQVECFSTGEELLDAARQLPPFDIVFLDIYLEHEIGIEIAHRLKAYSADTGIVFVTTSADFAVEAYSLDVLHYLVKPITQEGVVEALRRWERVHNRNRPLLQLNVGRSSYTLYLDEICYILSMNHAKEIHMTENRVIKVWMQMDALASGLNKNFMELNRSTIVNMEYIEQIRRDSCVLRDGTRLEIARRRSADIQAAYDEYVFKRMEDRLRASGEDVVTIPKHFTQG